MIKLELKTKIEMEIREHYIPWNWKNLYLSWRCKIIKKIAVWDMLGWKWTNIIPFRKWMRVVEPDIYLQKFLKQFIK